MGQNAEWERKRGIEGRETDRSWESKREPDREKLREPKRERDCERERERERERSNLTTTTGYNYLLSVVKAIVCNSEC